MRTTWMKNIWKFGTYRSFGQTSWWECLKRCWRIATCIILGCVWFDPYTHITVRSPTTFLEALTAQASLEKSLENMTRHVSCRPFDCLLPALGQDWRDRREVFNVSPIGLYIQYIHQYLIIELRHYSLDIQKFNFLPFGIFMYFHIAKIHENPNNGSKKMGFHQLSLWIQLFIATLHFSCSIMLNPSLSVELVLAGPNSKLVHFGATSPPK